MFSASVITPPAGCARHSAALARLAYRLAGSAGKSGSPRSGRSTTSRVYLPEPNPHRRRRCWPRGRAGGGGLYLSRSRPAHRSCEPWPLRRTTSLRGLPSLRARPFFAPREPGFEGQSEAVHLRACSPTGRQPTDGDLSRPNMEGRKGPRLAVRAPGCAETTGLAAPIHPNKGMKS